MTTKIGVIAGTGFYDLPALAGANSEEIKTDYGSALITRGIWNEVAIVFLTRHGVKHSVPPHRVNYRANIRAMHDLGVHSIIAVNVVGGIDPNLAPGDISLIDDFVDFTSGRANTFFDGEGSAGVNHVDMTNVYDKNLQSKLISSAANQDIKLATGGIYAGFNGPRFETPAEIRFARLAGATVVGMTGCPEAALARELAIPFVAIALIVNPAAGLSQDEITMSAIDKALQSGKDKVLKVIEGALPELAKLYV